MVCGHRGIGPIESSGSSGAERDIVHMLDVSSSLHDVVRAVKVSSSSGCLSVGRLR